MGRLPFELEHKICEMALGASGYPILPTIILVARRFREWSVFFLSLLKFQKAKREEIPRFEPELYRIIRAGEDNVIVPPSLYLNPPSKALKRLSLFTELEIHTNRLAAFGPHVRHILLQNRSSKEIRQVLDHCPNVQSLSLWIIHGRCQETLLPALEDFARRRVLKLLSFDPSHFFQMFDDIPIPFAQLAFSSLTHLEIINATSSWKKWSQIADMPHLTHLAVSAWRNRTRFILMVLKECKFLQVFILFEDAVFVDDSAILDNDNPTHDVAAVRLESWQWKEDYRVVVLRSVMSHLDDWEIGIRGGRDFWVTAERVKNVRLRYRNAM